MKTKYLLILFLFPLTLSAQNPFKVDMLLGTVQYKKATENQYQTLKKDTVLFPNTILRTGGNSYVKISSPQGVTMMIRPNSTFQITQFEGTSARMKIYTGESEFKITKNLDFQVNTPTIVAGVRGTLFKIASRPANSEKVVVYEGKVEVSSLQFPDREALSLTPGKKMEWVPAEEEFSPKLIKDAQTPELKDFQLAENTPLPVIAQKEQKEIQQQDQKVVQQTPLQEAKEESKPQKEEDIQKETKRQDKEQPEIKKEKPIEKDIRTRNLYFEFLLGGMEINNYYYHSITFAPHLKLGKWVRLGLYLPVYYDGNSKIYEVKKWGNYEEWNFSGTKDAIHDTLLKITYFKFREKGDLLYFGLGRLNEITLGSGFLVNNFDNAPLYPSEKVVGVEGGFDIGSTALYIFTNDIYDPQIIGARFFLRPLYGVPVLGQFQFGLQIVTDKSPLGKQSNPAVFAIALDLIFPVLESQAFSMIFFADVAKQGVYYSDWETRPATWADGTDLVHFHINDNYGADGGVKGNITSYFTYGFRYYYLHTGFVANYFDRFYFAQREARVNQILAPGQDDDHAFRIDAGLVIPGYLRFQAGFYKKMQSLNNENRLILTLSTQRGAFYKFWLTGTYEKQNIDNFFTGTDSYKKNAVMDLKLGYMISEHSDLVIRKLIHFDYLGNSHSQVMLETNFVF